MAREINLVPDIKGEMIKTLKLRNLIFFLCIVVAGASVGVTLIFGLIAGGQRVAMDNKKETILSLSSTLKSYGDLNDFLTIKDQLSNLTDIDSNQKVLSRTFNILTALLPTGPDTIKISELNVDLSGEAPVFSFDAQADAGQAPFIDYNVLDSFKKSLKYMEYDYGNYIDRNGNIIPTYCMIETNTDGTLLSDPTKGLYAFWTINADGCNPSAKSDSEDDQPTTNVNSYTIEEFNGAQVVRIWRRPQYEDWYKENPTDGEAYMDLSGNIYNIQHFESACNTYVGTVNQKDFSVSWERQAKLTCHLVPAGDEGIVISESSNGRDASNRLVLRFSATITFDQGVYDFNNKHMLAKGPSGRYNVTDSYVQIQNMFSQRAQDCSEEDADCQTNGGN